MPVNNFTRQFKDCIFISLQGSGEYKLSKEAKDFLIDIDSGNLTPQQIASKALETLCVDDNAFNEKWVFVEATLGFLERTMGDTITDQAAKDLKAILMSGQIAAGSLSGWVTSNYP